MIKNWNYKKTDFCAASGKKAKKRPKSILATKYMVFNSFLGLVPDGGPQISSIIAFALNLWQKDGLYSELCVLVQSFCIFHN